MIKYRGYWTKERCKREALKYETKKEFREKNISVYNKINKNKWFEFYSHMKNSKNDSRRCIYVYEFSNNYAYVGLTNNIKRRKRDHLKKGPIFNHIQRYNLNPTINKITDYINIDNAKKLEDFYIKLYKKNGWFILNKSKAGSLGSPIIKWTKSKIQEITSMFEYRSDFQKKYPGAYQRALRDNILDEVCSHMKKKEKKIYIKWTKERCQIEALKYETRSEFKLKSNGAYKVSLKNNILDEVCSHMTRRNKWDFNNVMKESKKYKTRTEFSKKSRGAYNFAYRNEMLDEVCSHMKKDYKQ